MHGFAYRLRSVPALALCAFTLLTGCKTDGGGGNGSGGAGMEGGRGGSGAGW